MTQIGADPSSGTSVLSQAEKLGLVDSSRAVRTTFWSFVREFSSLRPVKQFAGL